VDRIRGGDLIAVGIFCCWMVFFCCVCLTHAGAVTGSVTAALVSVSRTVVEIVALMVLCPLGVGQ